MAPKKTKVKRKPSAASEIRALKRERDRLAEELRVLKLNAHVLLLALGYPNVYPANDKVASAATHVRQSLPTYPALPPA